MKKFLQIASIILCTLLASMANSSDSDNVTADLRNMAFSLKPEEIGISQENFSHPVWGMMMETGLDDGSYSLLTLADGTTSLYLSSGGGTIGAGEHESVRDAVGYYLTGAQYFFEKAKPVEAFPRPAPGQVIFYFLGFDGVSAYEAPEQKLGEGHDNLSNLFYAAHKVIGEIRNIEQK